MSKKTAFMVLENQEPPDDFRTIDLELTKLNLNKEPFVRPNIVKGPFNSAAHYLDIQFRLLWADFLLPLRHDIVQYKKNPFSSKLRATQIHRKVFIEQYDREERSLTVRFKSSIAQDSKRFLRGSIVCFMATGSSEIIFTKITDNYGCIQDKEGFQMLDISFNELIRPNCPNYIMFEYNHYYEPYYQVLNRLQNMSINDFPLERYLVCVRTDQQRYPQYLSRSEIMKINSLKIEGFNKSQTVAFNEALTREFVLIQGPPGTGKTFIGSKIVQALLDISDQAPILIICYKNRSLDKFLEGLIPYTKGITRVGKRCKNEKIEPYTLHSKIEKIIGPLSFLYKITGEYILKKSLIIGMTTTCAARLYETLEELQCPIVIVDEAAEVLEAHIVASLTQYCKQLILIGDHQQLRPTTADHTIRTDYKLGISLFERMLLNEMPFFTLNEQYRMQPEISKLLIPTFYPNLTNALSVMNRPNIKGIAKNVFFITHSHRESYAGTSKKNRHEASFLIRLAAYLIRNNHGIETIMILATYSAQVDELHKEAEQYDKLLKNIKIATVDSYQGQESDIVLLSLVRSNNKKQIGFLNEKNRVCVALSRARNGLFIIGNMDFLCSNSKLWVKIRDTLKNQNGLGTELSLQCQIHKDTITLVKSSEDFFKVLNGGCSLKCNTILDCGHKCIEPCHIPDREHEKDFRCERAVCTIRRRMENISLDNKK